MRTIVIAVALCVAVLLGSSVMSGARPASVNAQPHDCNISTSFGTFKAVTAESWLLFEDGTGTLRAVDYGCHLQRVFNRQ
jgi:hypothetical protein